MNNAIFIAFDDNHWRYAKACLCSIQKNYPSHPDILIHYKGDNTLIKNTLLSIPKSKLYLNPVLPDNLLMPCFHKDANSELVYYKYLLWTKKYDEYDNIVYLDTDTIILKPFDNLFEKSSFFIIENNISFKEVKIFTQKSKVIIDRLYQHNLSYPEQDDMVNAGVFMIPKKYRTVEFYMSLINITSDFGPYLKYADQSAISIWCMKHQIKPAKDYTYNFQTPVFKKNFFPRYKNIGFFFNLCKSILYEIHIIHFSGPIKPDTPRFEKWYLMGRYAKIFKNCFKQYAKDAAL